MKIIGTIIILLLVTSCAEKIEREKLIGKYVWNDTRIDTLEVRAGRHKIPIPQNELRLPFDGNENY